MHRIGGPALRWWNDDGLLYCEYWFKDGLAHRLDGPAITEWDYNGEIDLKEWYINGQEPPKPKPKSKLPRPKKPAKH
jgi:hypothetical protein